jgi:hypothetical protein
MVKFDDLLVSWISWFNYDLVIVPINVLDFHMIIHVKSLCHFIMHLKSHGESWGAMGSHVMCKLLKNSCLISFWLVYKWVFVTFKNTFI